MAESDATDRELFTAWTQGQGRAGETLIQRHYDGVRRYFELRVSALADDYAQHTFLQCLQAANTLRDDGTFRGLLYGIARKVYQQHQRKEGRGNNAMRLVEAGVTQLPRTGVSTLVQRRREQRLLLMAMTDLPEPELSAVQLFYWEGLRSKEIAEVLEITVSGVTSRLHRARDRLSQSLERLSPGLSWTGQLDTELGTMVEGQGQDAPTDDSGV